MTTLNQITTLLDYSPDTSIYTTTDNTITLITPLFDTIDITLNTDDTITILYDTTTTNTYSNLDEFTSRFFYDYI